jgi:hypothetical protein
MLNFSINVSVGSEQNKQTDSSIKEDQKRPIISECMRWNIVYIVEAEPPNFTI